MSAVDPGEVLGRVRQRLARCGLNVVMPLGGRIFDEIVVSVGGTPSNDLLPGAGGVLIIGDGGPRFFEQFQSLRASPVHGVGPARHPLDDYTRQVLNDAVTDALAPWLGTIRFRLLYPFIGAQPVLPFQRLGQAAGLPGPGPLGIQIHPVYGPWWAYRGLVVLSVSVQADEVLAASCSGCHQPCVVACPPQAVTTAGWSYRLCIAHRRSAPGCQESCAARGACPVGLDFRYSNQQLAFHMRASLGPTPPPSEST